MSTKCEYTLNYASMPIGMAVMCLRGDVTKALELNRSPSDIRLIKLHWKLAEKHFRREAAKPHRKRKFKNPPLGKKEGPQSSLEVFQTWLTIAENTLNDL